jgi:hypothetical protein
MTQPGKRNLAEIKVLFLKKVEAAIAEGSSRQAIEIEREFNRQVHDFCLTNGLDINEGEMLQAVFQEELANLSYYSM